MNEFLTSFSSYYTVLWALFIIGVMAAAAVGLHVFWSVVLRSIAGLRSVLSRGQGGHR
tara:strand:- start:1638 stop:1811 length:174 start_codon:yes stop_codon:yes gene_type:complete